MKKISKKALINRAIDYGMDETLAKATIIQFGDYDYFRESKAQDITNYGINGGFGGFIYYSDTVPFAEKHIKSILAFAKQQANDIGYDSVYSMIASFNCFKGKNETDIVEAIYDPDYELRTMAMNGLAWYVGEEMARIYCDMLEAN